MADSAGQPLVKGVLILLMAVGSIVLWIANPIGWLYLASQIQANSSSAGFGPYLLVLAGVAVTVVVLTKLLAMLGRAYDRASGKHVQVKVRMPWHRSMRGDDDHRPPRNVLDVVMVISVSIAVVAMAVWFFLFAGSSLPT